MQSFILQANAFGATRKPFFFLIDFEQNQPILLPLAECSSHQIFFQFPDYNNVSFFDFNKPFEFSRTTLKFSRYQAAFELVKNEIQKGNSYLLNLAFPTKIQTNYSLEEIFIKSYAKYKLFYQDKFICFSPETFIRIKENKIVSYPMKGTINASEENAKQKLLNSKKEFEEHNTIVDLIRNDLAMVSQNIRVTKYRYVEKIETHHGAIYQTSSEICGELTENWQANIGSILAKLLPAGSISGAPKEKTVQIIQQAEGEKRGYYTGIFGYFDGNNLESAVAIRYIEKNEQGEMHFRSGGGITSQSSLEEEYQEILEKVYVPISRV